MKNSILTLSIYTCLSAAIFTSCSSTTDKVEQAENKVIDANWELEKANKEHLEEVEKYRKEVENKIEANNKIIADFNAIIENEKNDVKADYRKKIAELERKNTDTKKKMDEYKVEGKEKWADFKSKFNSDLEELGKALSNFFS